MIKGNKQDKEEELWIRFACAALTIQSGTKDYVNISRDVGFMADLMMKEHEVRFGKIEDDK